MGSEMCIRDSLFVVVVVVVVVVLGATPTTPREWYERDFAPTTNHHLPPRDADDEDDDHPRYLLFHRPRVSMVFGVLLVVPSLPIMYLFNMNRARCVVCKRERRV